MSRLQKPAGEICQAGDRGGDFFRCGSWVGTREDKGFKKYLLQLQVLHTEDQNKDLQRYGASKGLKS